MGIVILTIVALITVALAPTIVALPMGTIQRNSRLAAACVIAAVISVVWAIYWVTLANPTHTKHMVLFLILAVAALIAANFTRPVTA